MSSDDAYSLIIFKGFGGGVYSFLGQASYYETMLKGMPTHGMRPLYGIGRLETSDMDRVADALDPIMKRIEAGEKFDELGELNAVKDGWKRLYE